MMNPMAKFYDEIRRTEAEISRLIVNGGPSQEHQPRPVVAIDRDDRPTKQVEAVFCTSIADPLKDMVGGRVMVMTLRNAATRIVQRSHRLSTAEEVADYHQKARERKAFYDREDSARAQSFKVELPKQVAK